MERYRDIVDRMPRFAQQNGDIDAIVVVGSQSRREMPADEYSDLDVVIFCGNPQKYLDHAAWLEQFGNVVCTFVEPTIGGHTERRVLFSDNRDIDITVLPAFAACSEDLLSDAAMLEVLRNGYVVVYDKTAKVEAAFARALATAVRSQTAAVSNDTLNQLVGDVHYHVVWAHKKLLRGELWTAVSCINSYLVPRLLRMLSYERAAQDEPDYRRYGRLVDTELSQDLRDQLACCVSRYDRNEAHRALSALFEAFNRLAQTVYERAGHAFPEGQRAGVVRLMDAIDEEHTAER